MIRTSIQQRSPVALQLEHTPTCYSCAAHMTRFPLLPISATLRGSAAGHDAKDDADDTFDALTGEFLEDGAVEATHCRNCGGLFCYRCCCIRVPEDHRLGLVAAAAAAAAASSTGGRGSKQNRPDPKTLGKNSKKNENEKAATSLQNLLSASSVAAVAYTPTTPAETLEALRGAGIVLHEDHVLANGVRGSGTSVLGTTASTATRASRFFSAAARSLFGGSNNNRTPSNNNINASDPSASGGSGASASTTNSSSGAAGGSVLSVITDNLQKADFEDRAVPLCTSCFVHDAAYLVGFYAVLRGPEVLLFSSLAHARQYVQLYVPLIASRLIMHVGSGDVVESSFTTERYGNEVLEAVQKERARLTALVLRHAFTLPQPPDEETVQPQEAHEAQPRSERSSRFQTPMSPPQQPPLPGAVMSLDNADALALPLATSQALAGSALQNTGSNCTSDRPCPVPPHIHVRKDLRKSSSSGGSGDQPLDTDNRSDQRSTDHRSTHFPLSAADLQLMHQRNHCSYAMYLRGRVSAVTATTALADQALAEDFDLLPSVIDASSATNTTTTTTTAAMTTVTESHQTTVPASAAAHPPLATSVPTPHSMDSANGSSTPHTQEERENSSSSRFLRSVASSLRLVPTTTSSSGSTTSGNSGNGFGGNPSVSTTTGAAAGSTHLGIMALEPSALVRGVAVGSVESLRVDCAVEMLPRTTDHTPVSTTAGGAAATHLFQQQSPSLYDQHHLYGGGGRLRAIPSVLQARGEMLGEIAAAPLVSGGGGTTTGSSASEAASRADPWMAEVMGQQLCPPNHFATSIVEREEHEIAVRGGVMHAFNGHTYYLSLMLVWRSTDGCFEHLWVPATSFGGRACPVARAVAIMQKELPRLAYGSVIDLRGMVLCTYNNTADTYRRRAPTPPPLPLVESQQADGADGVGGATPSAASAEAAIMDDVIASECLRYAETVRVIRIVANVPPQGPPQNEQREQQQEEKSDSTGGSTRQSYCDPTTATAASLVCSPLGASQTLQGSFFSTTVGIGGSGGDAGNSSSGSGNGCESYKNAFIAAAVLFRAQYECNNANTITNTNNADASSQGTSITTSTTTVEIIEDCYGNIVAGRNLGAPEAVQQRDLLARRAGRVMLSHYQRLRCVLVVVPLHHLMHGNSGGGAQETTAASSQHHHHDALVADARRSVREGACFSEADDALCGEIALFPVPSIYDGAAMLRDYGTGILVALPRGSEELHLYHRHYSVDRAHAVDLFAAALDSPLLDSLVAGSLREQSNFEKGFSSAAASSKPRANSAGGSRAVSAGRAAASAGGRPLSNTTRARWQREHDEDTQQQREGSQQRQRGDSLSSTTRSSGPTAGATAGGGAGALIFRPPRTATARSQQEQHARRKKQQAVLECPLCYESYNPVQRKPCLCPSCGNTYCLACGQRMGSTCCFCRKPLPPGDKHITNVALLQMIDQSFSTD